MIIDFSSQRILIIGLAREGRAAARWLTRHHADVVASDLQSPPENARAELENLGVTLRIGPQRPDLLTNIDAIVVSPGVPQDIPLLQNARARGIPVTAEPRLFAQGCPAPIIGITGSSGKTTTTTLVARMVETSDHRTWLGGNIGSPLLARIEEISPQDRVVMELSSFQLLYWNAIAPWPAAPAPWNASKGVSPHVAAVLNITPNHLDRHPSMAHYAAAKVNILAAQTSDDIAILNRDDVITGHWAQHRQITVAAGPGQSSRSFSIWGRLLTFGFKKPLNDDGTWLEDGWIFLRSSGQTNAILNIDDIRLRGRHNLANVLAAVAIAHAAGAAPAAMREAVRTFSGVPHRLEEVARTHDVLWINDSIATAPERALAAMRSFDAPIILLAGGRDKHLPWEEWAQEAQRSARIVIAFGEAIPIIQQALQNTPAHARLQKVLTATDLPAAVHLANEQARSGEVVLLAPGGTSFDAYPDYAARGQHFRELVRQETAPSSLQTSS